jgi:hypothetical protein
MLAFVKSTLVYVRMHHIGHVHMPEFGGAIPQADVLPGAGCLQNGRQTVTVTRTVDAGGARSPIHQRSSLKDGLHALAGGPHLGLVAQITKMGKDGWIRVCNQVKDTDTDAGVL